jgi:hypothetical protein
MISKQEGAMTLPVALACLVSIALGAAVPSPEAVTLVPDTPTRLGSVEVVCTGVSLDARENPAWSAYPLKVEFVGRGGQYLGGVHVTLSMSSGTLATVNCNGPWLLFRLPSSRYRIDANIDGKTVSSIAIVAANGQSWVILRYPDLGGAVESVPMPAASARLPASQ